MRQQQRDIAGGELEAEQRVHASRYWTAWGALLILTGVTVGTAALHLGAWTVVISLAVATIKGLIVALLFMHLLEHAGASRIVLAMGFVFIVLIMSFTLADVRTRFGFARPADLSANDGPGSSVVRRR